LDNMLKVVQNQLYYFFLLQICDKIDEDIIVIDIEAKVEKGM